MEITNKYYVFKGKILFRSGVQQFGNDTYLRKSIDSVAKAKFTKKKIPIISYHDKAGDYGFVNNLTLHQSVDVAYWTGDVHFSKKNLTPIEEEELITGQRRGLSIDYDYNLKTVEDDPAIAGDQANIVVSHVSWENYGRCPYPLCGLDSGEEKDNERVKGRDNMLLTADLTEEEVAVIKKELAEKKEKAEESEVADKPKEKTEDPKGGSVGKDSNPCADSLKNFEELAVTYHGLDKQFKDLQKEYDELTEKLKGADSRIALYEEKDKAVLVEEIIKIASYDKKELEPLDLAKLQEVLSILNKNKVTAKDSYPPGEDTEKAKADYYDPKSGKGDLSALREKSDQSS